jgi:hypothetical protein
VICGLHRVDKGRAEHGFDRGHMGKTRIIAIGFEGLNQKMLYRRLK